MYLRRTKVYENAYPREGTNDKDGEMSWLYTDCGHFLYCSGGNYMKYDGCLCPACMYNHKDVIIRVRRD